MIKVKDRTEAFHKPYSARFVPWTNKLFAVTRWEVTDNYHVTHVPSGCRFPGEFGTQKEAIKHGLFLWNLVGDCNEEDPHKVVAKYKAIGFDSYGSLNTIFTARSKLDFGPWPKDTHLLVVADWHTEQHNDKQARLFRAVYAAI